MKPVIEVKQLGKCFRINDSLLQDPKRRLLSELLTNVLLSPFRRMKDPLGQANWQDFWALRDVNFSVDQGEVVGIIGLNGAGKSTLLKILTRICEPTKGEVRLRGRVGSLLEVGTGFHPELTGRENVFLNGSILGMTQQEIRSRFEEIVEFSGVERFLDTPVKHYSSGMRVRLAFSVAANLNPEILIIDEVLAVGDAPFRAKCIDKMRSLAQSGRTVLFVSHSTGVVQQLCSRVILLEEGQVKLIGDPGEVVNSYLIEQERSPRSASEDVSGRPREQSGLGKQARISNCSLHNSQGQRSSQIQFGEAFAFELEIQGRSHQSQLSVTLAIHAKNKACVAMVACEQQNLTIRTTPDSFTRIAISFDKLPLSPGFYSTTVGIRTVCDPKKDLSSKPVLLDIATECLSFQIADSPSEGFSLIENLHGYILPQPKWQIQENRFPSQSSKFPDAA